MDNKNFTYNLTGVFEPSVTDAEVKADGDFGKTVHLEICRILARFGVKSLNTAWIEAAGKKITLPTDILAVAGK
jgi:hypothetical protein